MAYTVLITINQLQLLSSMTPLQLGRITRNVKIMQLGSSFISNETQSYPNSGNKAVVPTKFVVLNQKMNHRPKIILFGDSITQDSFANGGWGASLAHQFSRTADVVVRGYSGYNTRWVLKMLDKLFPPEKEAANGGDPAAITVFFGANDSCLPNRYAAFQHVPIDEYKLNLHSIVSSLQKRWPTTRIILITPPPIDEAARLLNPYMENPSGLLERLNEVTGAYADACISVAGECGIPVVNLWAKMQQYPDWHKAYLSDGLHLTKEGNQIVFQEVIARLNEEGLSPESLPSDLPLFSKIDPAHPLKAFE